MPTILFIIIGVVLIIATVVFLIRGAASSSTLEADRRFFSESLPDFVEETLPLEQAANPVTARMAVQLLLPAARMQGETILRSLAADDVDAHGRSLFWTAVFETPRRATTELRLIPCPPEHLRRMDPKAEGTPPAEEADCALQEQEPCATQRAHPFCVRVRLTPFLHGESRTLVEQAWNDPEQLKILRRRRERRMQAQPRLPLYFTDSPLAVRRLTISGADPNASSAVYPLATHKLDDGRLVWRTTLDETPYDTPFHIEKE